jgi:ribosome-binding protein aMBF1 (putative translation factor)
MLHVAECRDLDGTPPKSARMCDYRTVTSDRGWADVGEQLRQTRLSAGMSQGELGDAVGLDRTMIAKWKPGPVESTR